jgi:phage-related protein
MLEVAITIIGIAVSLLAGAVTYLAWRNGKVVRENTDKVITEIREMRKGMRELIKEIGNKIDQGFRLIALLILAETPEEKRKIAKKILGEEDQK